MKGLPLTIQKIWPRLQFLKSGTKVKVKGHKVKNFVSNGIPLSGGIYMSNMKGLALVVQKLRPKLKFLKSRSKVKTKGHWVKFLVSVERSCLSEYTCEI